MEVYSQLTQIYELELRINKLSLMPLESTDSCLSKEISTI